MQETSNKVRQKDLDELVMNPIFDFFKNKAVLVTGATGLIGSELVLAFLCANRLKNLNIKIVALARNENKANKIFSEVLNRDNFEFVIQDVNDKINYSENIDYIIHTASITQSKMMIEKPFECAMTTINGTKNILDFALNTGVKSTCYLSSIEAYGEINSDDDVKEENLGFIDITNPRSSYPQSKRMAENLCISYAKEFNIDVKIARLTQTFGAGISEDDNRIFAQFARCIKNKDDIVLHTDGSSYKNYCYLTDAISGILTILIKGENKNIYNISNYETGISIKDLAQKLVDKYQTSKLKIELKDNMGYPKSTKIKLNSKKLEALGWHAQINLDDMFDRLINSLC